MVEEKIIQDYAAKYEPPKAKKEEKKSSSAEQEEELSKNLPLLQQ